MAVTRTIYDTYALYGVFEELEPAQAFWLQFFPNVFNSEAETIEFNKITNRRHLAPFVVPTAQGRPMYRADERVTQLKPAYIKPKDAIEASGAIRRRAGLGELGQAPQLSPQARYDRAVAHVLMKHVEAIERRWEWMAAQAILNGAVVIQDDAYPSTTVDFARQAANTITLAAGSRWGDSGVSIVDNIESWSETMVDAEFGGAPSYCIMGPTAWKAAKTDPQILQLLETDRRQTSQTSLNLGPGNGAEVQFKGMLSNNLELWVYRDYYQAPDNTVVPYMDARDVVMIANNVDGVKAFGAIQDKGANLQPLEVFPKMWEENDPSATIMMTQSAPLMVPVNPNATLRARVVA